ncbi:MAG: formate dehydrogenase subunit gamma [Pseudomonadota bacterium]|nr:formate dehydrogenase subunit gamma [Pseudomonadota bacterium]
MIKPAQGQGAARGARSIGRRMGHLLSLAAAIVFSGAVIAQTPAVSSKDADYARAQQQRQLSQPQNNSPLWEEVRSGLPQFTTVPGRETNVLVQSEGQTWRALRVPVYSTGGLVFALALLGIVLFYTWRGPIITHAAPTGHLIRRYTTRERIVHWTVAITFVIQGITGLVITFGKGVLLPLIGYTLFSWLAILSKNLHNFVGPIFSMALPIMIVTFIHENLPRAYDWAWVKRFGGMLDRNGREPPSGKANAGQKMLFWLMVVASGITLVVSGLILDFPNFNQTRQTMQVANIVHLVAALVGVTLAAAHIYLGTIGMKGAYSAMRHGYVDESWAREHHEIWYHEVVADKAQRGLDAPAPAPAPEARAA